MSTAPSTPTTASASSNQHSPKRYFTALSRFIKPGDRKTRPPTPKKMERSNSTPTIMASALRRITPVPDECQCTRMPSPDADFTETGAWGAVHQRILRLAGEIAPDRGPFVIQSGLKRQSSELQSWYVEGHGRPQLQQRQHRFELYQRLLIEMPPRFTSAEATPTGVTPAVAPVQDPFDELADPHESNGSLLGRADPHKSKDTLPPKFASSFTQPTSSGSDAQPPSSWAVEEADIGLDTWNAWSRGVICGESARANTPSLAYDSLLNIMQRAKDQGQAMGETPFNADAWAAENLCSACGKSTPWSRTEMQ